MIPIHTSMQILIFCCYSWKGSQSQANVRPMEFLAASDNISSDYETFFKCLKNTSLSKL